jgi:hypothetical protein
MIAESYGFRYIDKKQYLEKNMLILHSNIFAGAPFHEKITSYAIHNCNGSWRNSPRPLLFKKILRRIKKIITLPNRLYIS